MTDDMESQAIQDITATLDSWHMEMYQAVRARFDRSLIEHYDGPEDEMWNIRTNEWTAVMLLAAMQTAESVEPYVRPILHSGLMSQDSVHALLRQINTKSFQLLQQYDKHGTFDGDMSDQEMDFLTFALTEGALGTWQHIWGETCE